MEPSDIEQREGSMSKTVHETKREVPMHEDELRWFGEPVYVSKGSPDDLASLIPRFDRRPFCLPDTSPGQKSRPTWGAFLATGENRLSDLIVRVPLNEKEAETPVATVSKQYRLVQHRELFEGVLGALRATSVALGEVSAELTLSAYGSKMALTFTLPKKFAFDPGDGHSVNLCLHCVNSVDGRCRLRIMLGWFRFICGNGLVVGTAQLSQRFIHNEYLELPDLTLILSEGLKSTEKEKESFAEWLNIRIEGNHLCKWIDGALRDEWGPLAAARVHLICETGQDGRFARPGEQAPPHRKAMVQTVCVPGAPRRAENAYHIAQALAWVAKGRRDIQDQLDGMVAIPKLMAGLLR
jgi:Domain of unknown function (DUF932)